MARPSHPFLRHRNLTKAEKAKVDILEARYSKASAEKAKAKDTLSSYRVFRIYGKVQAGDATYADIYGEATQSSGAQGPGTISEKTFIRVLNPFNDDYNGGNYIGDSLFLGVIKGINTYLPIGRDQDYVAARNALEKWKGIENSIQGEINMVYLPYKKEAKNQAQEAEKVEQQIRDRDKAQSAIDTTNRARVEQAKEDLAQEKRQLELAKQGRITKEAADAEIARLAAEQEKVRVEKATIDAENQKREQEANDLEAKKLQEVEGKKEAGVETLKNTVSIVPGERLGKVRLGMTEAQVLQLMGKPEQSIQLNKTTLVAGPMKYQGGIMWLPRRIRRDRYSLQATEGLDIVYQGTPQELGFLARERLIKRVTEGDLKTTFVYDVFFLDGKVVQIASDSPQFFNSEKQNLQKLDFEANYEEIVECFGLWNDERQTVVKSGDAFQGLTFYSAIYAGDMNKGLSLCQEFTTNVKQASTFPDSRRMLIIHNPKTVPYTGDFQKGISVFNKKDGRSDADNIEERLNRADLNPSIAQSVVSNAAKSGSDGVKKKVKEGLGRIFGR